MRYWLLTNRTYGTWLPGDRRGSVTDVRDRRLSDPVSSHRLTHNKPGEACEAHLAGLERSAHSRLKGPPILLTTPQAAVFLEQLRETATYRGWLLQAVAIMTNHFHLVVAVTGDPKPRKILADFKSYGTRALNRQFGRPPSETWWATNGSKRKLPDQRAIAGAINYVLHKHPHQQLTWAPADPPTLG